MIEMVCRICTNSENNETFRTREMMFGLIDEFTYRTAQWQKSVQGKNLERAIDLALAETETKTGLEDDFTGADAFRPN